MSASLHVQLTQALRLVDKRPLLDVCELFPRVAELLADLRVVHLRVVLHKQSTFTCTVQHDITLTLCTFKFNFLNLNCILKYCR